MKEQTKMFIALSLLIIGLIMMITPISATQPTQQSNKLFLNPFYRSAMTNNNNYTFNITINPPDKINSVLSAIVSFDIYLTPSVTFYLWVNGQPCNNPTYLVSTTYASAGQSRVTFDCSNVITQAGFYNIILKPTQANTGAVNGWIDLTYMNNPKGELQLSGTEYQINDIGTAFVQLLDNNKLSINNASCFISSYYPNKTMWWNNNIMTYLSGSDGLYYQDFTSPNVVGTYMLSSSCYIPTISFTDVFNAFSKINDYKNVTIVNHYLTLAIPTNSTGLKNPSAYGDDYTAWTNPQNAIGSDDSRATTSVNGEQEDWYNFSFNIPESTILGIIVSLEGSTASGTTGVDVEISRKGGLNYTSTGYGYTTASTTDTIRTFGNSTDLWGRTGWTSSDFNHTNFRIRLTKTGTAGVNHRIDNILVNVTYLATPLKRGYAHSIDINLTGYLWKNFNATYTLNDGDITFEVRNQNNVTLCTGLGDISICANNTSPIKLYALLTTNGTLPSSSPTLDDWTLTWLTNETIQEIQGSGELHISNYVSGLNSSITNIQINHTAIAQAVWDYNGTINTNILNQIAQAVWNLFNTTNNFIASITNSVWTRTDRNLTYYPTQNATDINYTLIANMVWQNLNRSLTTFEFDVINETEVSNAVWTAINRTLTENPITNNISAEEIWSYYNRSLTIEFVSGNNLTAEQIWDYYNRSLTYYPTYSFSVNGTDIASQVWNYNGTIAPNILTQFSNKVLCVVGNLLNEQDREKWGVDISIC